jgi:hypothetical protein
MFVISPSKSFITLVMMSSTVWHLLPLRVLLSLGNSKSQEGRGQVNMGLWKGRNWMFCQELSNWQCYVSGRIIVMEESASHSPHFRPYSLYCIMQTSQNHQIKSLIVWPSGAKS